MARSVNMVILLGNVGADPEVRSTPGGQQVATISLATSRQWKDKSGEKQEKTEWHRLVVWGTLAEIVEKYVKKGTQLHVVGSVEYRQWDDKDGNKRYSTEINVRDLSLLGGGNGGNGGNGGSGRDAAPAGRSRSRVADSPAMKRNAAETFDDFPGALEDDDDGLPF